MVHPLLNLLEGAAEQLRDLVHQPVRLHLHRHPAHVEHHQWIVHARSAAFTSRSRKWCPQYRNRAEGCQWKPRSASRSRIARLAGGNR